MDWLQFGITVGSILVAIALAWGRFKTAIAEEFGKIDTRLGIFEATLTEIKTNHLKHIERSMEKIADKIVKDSERITRIEEQSKIKK